MTTENQAPEFDFDTWAALAKSDPEAFERQRTELLDAAIASAPEHMQRRLHGLQWRLDQIRSHSRTPMAACIRMSSQMWDNVLGEDGLIAHLTRLGEPVDPDVREGGEIVPLRPPQDSPGEG
ncbi:MAG: DUF3135 domain-containing protein [Gammaproteobacteria bacterium]